MNLLNDICLRNDIRKAAHSVIFDNILRRFLFTGDDLRRTDPYDLTSGCPGTGAVPNLLTTFELTELRFRAIDGLKLRLFVSYHWLILAFWTMMDLYLFCEAARELLRAFFPPGLFGIPLTWLFRIICLQRAVILYRHTSPQRDTRYPACTIWQKHIGFAVRFDGTGQPAITLLDFNALPTAQCMSIGSVKRE